MDAHAPFHIGEMAHVIAHSGGGPRGNYVGGDDTYENLILLCPSCHKTIDKAPTAFPETLLNAWKAAREKEVSDAGREKVFPALYELKRYVSGLLAENYEVFSHLGPKSKIAFDDPGSSAHSMWEARRIDTILPNNRAIINAISSNRNLLEREDLKAYAMFRAHALGYEENVYERAEYYPLFPMFFQERFSSE